MDWFSFKLMLVEVAGVSRDALHVIAGVALQLFAAMLLRRRASDWLPWLLVAAAAAANEWHDLWFDIWPVRAAQWGESVKDMATTLALPTLLLILTRCTPGLFVPVKPARVVCHEDELEAKSAPPSFPLE